MDFYESNLAECADPITTKLPCGSHEGFRLVELDLKFLRWLEKNKSSPPSMRAAASALVSEAEAAGYGLPGAPQLLVNANTIAYFWRRAMAKILPNHGISPEQSKAFLTLAYPTLMALVRGRTA